MKKKKYCIYKNLNQYIQKVHPPNLHCTLQI